MIILQSTYTLIFLFVRNKYTTCNGTDFEKGMIIIYSTSQNKKKLYVRHYLLHKNSVQSKVNKKKNNMPQDATYKK